MRGWTWTAVPALFLALLLLPGGREIEELSLVTALAVDRDAGGIRLTAVTGVRASEGEEPEVLTGQGEDLEAACRAVRESRASHTYLGQTDKLLLGEDLARTGLFPTLEFVLDRRELRLDTCLYVVRGDAGAGLEATAPDAAGETPGEDRRGRSVAQTLALLCEGRRALVPALAPDGEGKLTPAGWAVLEPRGLIDYQEEDEAMGPVVADAAERTAAQDG